MKSFFFVPAEPEVRMKRITLFLLVVSGLWTVGHPFQDEQFGPQRILGFEEAESPRQLSPSSVGTTEELDRILSDIAASKVLPGFGAAVVTGDRVLFQKGYGFADIEKEFAYTPHSLHYIASVSKTLIGVSM